MTTIVTIPYTIDAGNLVLTDTGRTMGNPGSNLTDLETRDPVAFAAINEFNSLGTTSGVVTVTAV